VPRLGTVTRVIVWIGAVVVGLALIQPLVPSRSGRFTAEMLAGLYGWTSLYCLLQFGVIAWMSRRSTRQGERASRPSSDATWYLPVYVWGIESNVNVVNVTAGDGWPCLVAVQQALMLLVTLGLCLGAEAWARRRGRPARATQGALPLPVVAAIISVEMPWLMFTLPQLYRP